MGHNQKKAGIVQYEPSGYQKKIFEFIEHGKGNLLIEATAGAGKTWTLLKSIELIPSDKSIIFLAFNKDIVAELKKKTKGIENINVSTLHSLGYSILKENLRDQALYVDNLKYSSYIYNNLSKLTVTNLRRMNRKMFFTYKDNVKKYVDYGRYYLCECTEDFEFIRDRYAIEDIADEMLVAQKIMAWGMTNLASIDYTDMIWLPNVLDIDAGSYKYDYIMADECQDINRAERMLLLRCFKEGTRLVCVGDPNQAIYSFAGSDPESFNELKKLPNMTCLPLSISYRCARNIVTFANKLVPTMEPSNDERTGEVKYDLMLTEVKDGDMMVCRNNAPLIQIYVKLIKQGKKAYVRGKDVGEKLISMVNGTEQELLNVSCEKDGVFARLYNDLFSLRNKIMIDSKVDEIDAMSTSMFLDELDRIKTLEYLSEDILTSAELISKLSKAFENENMIDGISLSTVHKAKGLEADRVFIVAPDLMPSKSAKKDWEKTQEMNLMYVAYTRAKNSLFFLSDTEIDDTDVTDDYNMTQLRLKEALTEKALCKSTSKVFSLKEAMEMARKTKPIIMSNPSSNTIAMSGQTTNKSFADMWKSQTSKAKKRKIR